MQDADQSLLRWPDQRVDFMVKAHTINILGFSMAIEVASRTGQIDDPFTFIIERDFQSKGPAF